jgi:hypothetical protein
VFAKQLVALRRQQITDSLGAAATQLVPLRQLKAVQKMHLANEVGKKERSNMIQGVSYETRENDISRHHHKKQPHLQQVALIFHSFPEVLIVVLRVCFFFTCGLFFSPPGEK